MKGINNYISYLANKPDNSEDAVDTATQIESQCISADERSQETGSGESDFVPSKAVTSNNLWSQKEGKFLSLSFTTESSDLHSYYKCRNCGCNSLSSVELTRLKAKSDDKSQHHWIIDGSLTFCKKTGINWLVYLEGDGMFCLLCRRHNCSNSQNKSKKLNLEPSVRYKRKTVEDHANSQQHKNAVMAELLSRMSYFQKELDRKETTKDSVYYNALLTIYWLAKEEVANKKFVSLLKLLEQVGVEDMRFFQHRSQGSIREMFLLLGNTVKAQMIRKVSEGSSYGLLLDEVCDITNKEQLVTFIKYIDRKN